MFIMAGNSNVIYIMCTLVKLFSCFLIVTAVSYFFLLLFLFQNRNNLANLRKHLSAIMWSFLWYLRSVKEINWLNQFLKCNRRESPIKSQYILYKNTKCCFSSFCVHTNTHTHILWVNIKHNALFLQLKTWETVLKTSIIEKQITLSTEFSFEKYVLLTLI